MHEVSEEFTRCWRAALRHIEAQARAPLQSWLKANLQPPFLEHLSFRLGNRLFFIRIEDVDEKLEIPAIAVDYCPSPKEARALPV
jgi:hypothetical protein